MNLTNEQILFLNNRIKVTVLMSVYNGEKYLKEAIDSILSQTFTEFEFIIIDDGSTDSTPEILASYDDSRIRIVTNEENLGLTKSLNIGLHQARGEYIARMDADDISFPNRLKEEVQYLEDNKDVVLVGTGREIIDINGKKIGTFIPPKIIDQKLLIRENVIQHSSVMFRKVIIMQEGGYCNNLYCGQDLYLWLKLVKRYQIHNILKILTKLRVHGESISCSDIHRSIKSHIFINQVITNRLREKDIDYEKEICYTKNERLYYYNRLADYYRIIGDYKSAQKTYLKIIKFDICQILALINYFRFFLPKKIITKTTNIYRFVRK